MDISIARHDIVGKGHLLYVVWYMFHDKNLLINFLLGLVNSIIVNCPFVLLMLVDGMLNHSDFISNILNALMLSNIHISLRIVDVNYMEPNSLVFSR